MKRKLTLVVCVIALFALVLTLASCNNEERKQKTHTHTYAQEWSSSEVGHWYAATCGCQGEISNYGAHVDENNDGICDKCKYQICAHSYADAWTSDAENHWKAPTCGHNVVAEKGAHVDANKDGNCDTCAYVVCAHTYATAWTSDATNHWHAATCGCDVKKDVTAHVDAVFDGKCDVCSYVICAHVDADKNGNCDDCDYVVCAHTYADVWSSDENNHWHAANCGCNVANKDVAAHVDADKDGICDVCAYVVCTHTFDKTTYATSGSHHWYAATCGCNVKDSYEEHVDEAKDGVCDVCEAEICAHTYADTKTWDAAGHWYAATCGCDVKKDYEEHTYATEWSKDELGHWYAATCGCEVQGSFAAHDDTVFDGVCDVCAYVICAHVDANKDGICDDCTYVMCTHTFADTLSSNENTHWYAATCGCNVKKDEAAHDDAPECSACGRSSAIKNAIDNLDSEAYLDVNSSVVIIGGESENSYKVYDKYVVIKDTFGNTRYFSFYGENDENLFVINVDEFGTVIRELDVEDVATLATVISYYAVYYNVHATNNEDFIKGLYDLGVNGSVDWDGNPLGTSYGFIGTEKDGTFVFSYVYVEEGNYYYVEATFTVDSEKNGIATASVVIKQYAEGVTVDDATDTYVISDNAEVVSTEAYEITQSFGAAMDSTSAPNPYPAENYIVDDFTITLNGEAVNDGDTVNVTAGETIDFLLGADVADNIKYSLISAIATNSEGEELGQWGSNSIRVDNYDDNRPVKFISAVADSYTVTIAVEGKEITFTVNVAYKAPTSITPVVYDEFNDANVKTNEWILYFGQSLNISASVAEGCNPAFTAALGANAMAVLKDNGDGTWKFQAVMTGDYEITITSAVDASVKSVLKVSVVDAPSISDVINGTVSADYFEYMTWTEGTLTLVFTPASNGATEGTLTITNAGYSYSTEANYSTTSTYTYKYNAETGAIELTYVSGEAIEIELSVANYKVCAVYNWENLVFTAETSEDPDEPSVDVPTTSPFEVTVTDTYAWEDEFVFIAGEAGDYTFNVTDALGFWSDTARSPELDYQMSSATSFTMTLSAGQKVVFTVSAPVRGTYTVTFTFKGGVAPEKPTVQPGLAGTYVATDDWGGSFNVTVTEDTITFQPPRSPMVVLTYTYVDGVVTLYSEGEALTNPMFYGAAVDATNEVFTELTYGGTFYTLEKQPSQGGEEPEPEPEAPTTIVGTYEAKDGWGNILTVEITETTISFSTMRGDVLYYYTYVDGVASYTDTNGNPVTMEQMFSLTIENGRVTGMIYNGTTYTLTLIGQGGDEEPKPEEPTDIELVIGENQVPVTGDSFEMTVVTFTATQDGTYKFIAGEGVVILYNYAPTLEGETLTITATAGQVITLEVNDMYYNAGYSLVTVVFEGAEEPEVNVLDMGENEVTLTEAQLENGVDYEFTATVAGMYTFASNDLLAIFFNENGMQIGRGQIYLEAGQTITVTFVCFAMEAGTYTATVSVETGDDEEEDELILVEGENTIVIGDDQVMDGVDYVYVAPEEGNYSVEGDLLAIFFSEDGIRLGAGMVSLAEGQKVIVKFVNIEELPGTFVITFITPSTEIGGDDDEPVVDDPQAELKALLGDFGYKVGDYTVSLTQDWDTGVYYIEVTDSEWTIDICFTYEIVDNGDGTFTITNIEYYQVAWESGLESIDTVIAAVDGATISANLTNNAVLGYHFINGYTVSVSRNYETGAYEVNIYDDMWTVDLYFTYEAIDNGNGTYTIVLTYVPVDWESGSELVDTLLAMDWVVGEVEEPEQPEDPEEPEEPSNDSLVLGENQVPVTGEPTEMTTVTFTATEAGKYTFTLGDGVVIEYTNGFTLEYESVTFTLAAGETITLAVNNMYYTAGMGLITISYEAESDDDGEETTVLYIGSNTINFTADDMEAGGKEYTFYALVNGQYTFASNDVGARVFENGMMVGMGSVHLDAGKTYTVVVFAMAEGTYTLNITAVEDQIGGDDEEETGTEANPTVWDELPSEITIDSDTINKIYYTFTATQSGTLTITYPTADSWADLYAWENNEWNGRTSQSSSLKAVAEFAIEAGVTYRLGIGTFNVAGEFTLPIAIVEGEIGGGEEPEPEEPSSGVIVEGSITVEIGEDQLQDGVDYPYVAPITGTYTVTSEDVMAIFIDAEGMQIGRGQVILSEGQEVTIKFVSLGEAGIYTVTLTIEAEGGSEDDEESTEGTMDNPIVWDELPSSVTINSDTMNQTYYQFTATESGALIITFPSGESYASLYAVIDGEIDWDNQSSYMKSTVQFAIEEGVTYLLGLSTANMEGEFILPIEVGEFSADGSMEYPYEAEFDVDYVANFQGGYTGLYYVVTVTENGYVTVSSTYAANPWLQIGTDAYDLTNNMIFDMETYETTYANSVSVYAFAGQTIYIAVGDGDFEAGEVPFVISFRAFESESSDKVAGTWFGEVDNWGSITTYTVVINADGTGSIAEDYGWGAAEYTITFILVDGSNVTITAEDEYGNVSCYTFVYDAEADTLTGTGDLNNTVFTKA